MGENEKLATTLIAFAIIYPLLFVIIQIGLKRLIKTACYRAGLLAFVAFMTFAITAYVISNIIYAGPV